MVVGGADKWLYLDGNRLLGMDSDDDTALAVRRQRLNLLQDILRPKHQRDSEQSRELRARAYQENKIHHAEKK